MIMYGPYTRAEADKVTREFTERLAANVRGDYHVGPVYQSGNIRDEETGWVFDVTDNKHQFSIEVYGPLIEKEDV